MYATPPRSAGAARGDPPRCLLTLRNELRSSDPPYFLGVVARFLYGDFLLFAAAYAGFFLLAVVTARLAFVFVFFFVAVDLLLLLIAARCFAA